ncbi:MAG: DNA-processing protein DprA, partial [bacterium]
MKNNKYTTPVKMLALCKFAGATPRLFTVLMHKFKALDSILDTDAFDLAKIDGMKESTAKSISKAKTYLDKAEEYYKKLSDREIRVITSFDTDYPALLNELNDPPPILFSRGKIPDSNKKSVTILGTTDATNEGIELTINLTKRLVKADILMVSTLNKG